MRWATRVAVLAHWLSSYKARSSDFAVIKLHKPFSVIQDALLKVETTPPSGEEILGVIGFPGDKWVVNKDGTSEAGTKMYESWKVTAWDVKSGMPPHSIPTSGGIVPGFATLVAHLQHRIRYYGHL